MPLKLTSATQVASLNKWADSVDLRLGQHLTTLQKHNQTFVQVAAAQTVFQTNGVTNEVQNKLNLVAGSNMTLTPDTSGNVKLNATVQTGVSLTGGIGGFFGAGFPLVSLYGTQITNGNPSTTINQITVMQFVLPVAFTISMVSLRIGTGVAAAKVNVGIYDINGNLLIDSGGLNAATSSTTVSTTLAQPVLLPAGPYYFAQSSSNTSVTVVSAFLESTTLDQMINATGTVKNGQAANPTVANALPATLGVITADSLFVNMAFPFFAV